MSKKDESTYLLFTFTNIKKPKHPVVDVSAFCN